MAKKVILKDDNIEIMPITRGELVLDSSGQQAFHSSQFLATQSQPGLMSGEDKTKLDSLEKVTVEDKKVEQVNTTTNNSYRILFSNSADDTTKTEGARKSAKLLFNPSTGALTATALIGKLDWSNLNDVPENFTPAQHIHNTSEITALTSYSKASSASDLVTTDTLNVALGKLEYKADTAYTFYKSITGTDNDEIINKWEEIVDFVDSVKEGSDITDMFVTRETDQTITGVKTFAQCITIQSGQDTKLVLNNTDTESKYQFISFRQNGTQYGYLGTLGDDVLKWSNNTILHSGNSYIQNGVITINGATITPITSHQSLANYVTLNGKQDITGEKTFKATIKAYDINPVTNNTYSLGTSSLAWKNVYATNGNFSSTVNASGFVKKDSSDSYVLLGGGGHKALSDFAMASAYVKKAGDTMTGPLTISTATWGNQLVLNRVNNGENWGPSIIFKFDGTHNGSLTMQSNQLYVGDNGGVRYKAWHEGNDGSGSGLDADLLDGIDSTRFLRQVIVPNNTENDFNTFSNMTLTGRVDPTTGASLKNAPWSGSGPAGGYGTLTYLFNGSGYGTQMAWGYNSNKIYIRNRYWGGSGVGSIWSTTWDAIALTSDIPTVTNYYWANINVSASSNAYTTPQFGKVTIYDGTNAILSLKTTTAGEYAYLAAYNTGGQYGADVVLHSGSAMVLGSGESAASMYDNNVDSLRGSENLYLTADTQVKIFTNCDSIGNRKHAATFTTDGYSFFHSYINIGGHEKNASSPSYVWGSNSTDNYLRSYQTSSLSVNYASSSGTCNGNAKGLYPSGYGNNNLTYYQTDGSFFGNSGWCHYIIANHGDGSNYYNFTFALPFWGSPKYKRLEGGTAKGWYTFITTENYTTELDGRYVNQAGDTMTGNLTVPSLFINTGDPTLKIYSGKVTDAKSDGNICLQTCIDGQDGQTHRYAPNYPARENLVLQPRGGQVYIGTNPDGGNTSYKLWVNGNTYASGSQYAAHFYENSDAKLKENIQAILDHDNIPQIKEFDWKESGEHSYGLIAQELEEQGYSELVSTKDDGYKTVNYSAALSLIVGKLQVKIKELEKEIEILKNKN